LLLRMWCSTSNSVPFRGAMTQALALKSRRTKVPLLRPSVSRPETVIASGTVVMRANAHDSHAILDDIDRRAVNHESPGMT
jgi:hypothetical protein